MKTILFTTLTFLLFFKATAQNKNIKDETKTTTTTITNSEGEKTFIKNENTREVQQIELKDEKPNTLNIETKNTPVIVTTTSKTTYLDGSILIENVNLSSYYLLNGEKFQIIIYEKGYNLKSLSRKNSAILRKTSNNNYIYKNKDRVGFGYFDNDRNFIIESYNPKLNTVKTEKFEIVK